MKDITLKEQEADYINERLTAALQVLENVDFESKGLASDYREGPAFACGYAASAIQGVLIELLKARLD